MVLRTMIQCVATAALVMAANGASAEAASEREKDVADFIQPAYPLFLAQAGLWGMDATKTQVLVEHAARGLAAVAPQDCDGTAFKRDLCGLTFLTMPATSMEPSIREKEVFAVKPYGNLTPKRGDIIVFNTKSFSDTQQMFVKRLIGLPGDTVEMRGGLVVVNGETYPTTPTERTMVDTLGKTGTILEETMPDGRRYEIAMNDSVIKGADDAGPFHVPPDAYFVLGDNRHNSVDSRFADMIGENGFIPAANVTGRVATIFVSQDENRVGTVFD